MTTSDDDLRGALADLAEGWSADDRLRRRVLGGEAETRRRRAWPVLVAASAAAATVAAVVVATLTGDDAETVVVGEGPVTSAPPSIPGDDVAPSRQGDGTVRSFERFLDTTRVRFSHLSTQRPTSLADLMSRSDAVIHGRISKVELVPAEVRRGEGMTEARIDLRMTIEVERVLKEPGGGGTPATWSMAVWRGGPTAVDRAHERLSTGLGDGPVGAEALIFGIASPASDTPGIYDGLVEDGTGTARLAAVDDPEPAELEAISDALVGIDGATTRCTSSVDDLLVELPADDASATPLVQVAAFLRRLLSPDGSVDVAVSPLEGCEGQAEVVIGSRKGRVRYAVAGDRVSIGHLGVPEGLDVALGVGVERAWASVSVGECGEGCRISWYLDGRVNTFEATEVGMSLKEPPRSPHYLMVFETSPSGEIEMVKGVVLPPGVFAAG